MGGGTGRGRGDLRVPFSTLLNPDLPRQYTDGERAGAWYWADQTQDIWGVTALILKSLASLVLDAARGERVRSD